MSMTDKEIALELTKAYLNHLNVRAQSESKHASHATVEGTQATYKAFHSTVSSSSVAKK